MAYMLQGRIASKRLNGGALPSDLKECRSQLLPDAAPKVFWVDKCGISEDELRVGKEALEWALRWKVLAHHMRLKKTEHSAKVWRAAITVPLLVKDLVLLLFYLPADKREEREKIRAALAYLHLFLDPRRRDAFIWLTVVLDGDGRWVLVHDWHPDGLGTIAQEEFKHTHRSGSLLVGEQMVRVRVPGTQEDLAQEELSVGQRHCMTPEGSGGVSIEVPVAGQPKSTQPLRLEHSVWVKSQAVSLMQDHAQHCPKPIPRWPELLSHFTTAYKTGSMMCPDYLTDSSMEMEASGFAMPDAEQSDAAWEAYLNRRTKELVGTCFEVLLTSYHLAVTPQSLGERTAKLRKQYLDDPSLLSAEKRQSAQNLVEGAQRGGEGAAKLRKQYLDDPSLLSAEKQQAAQNLVEAQQRGPQRAGESSAKLLKQYLDDPSLLSAEKRQAAQNRVEGAQRGADARAAKASALRGLPKGLLAKGHGYVFQFGASGRVRSIYFRTREVALAWHERNADKVNAKARERGITADEVKQYALTL